MNPQGARGGTGYCPGPELFLMHFCGLAQSELSVRTSLCAVLELFVKFIHQVHHDVANYIDAYHAAVPFPDARQNLSQVSLLENRKTSITVLLLEQVTGSVTLFLRYFR